MKLELVGEMVHERKIVYTIGELLEELGMLDDHDPEPHPLALALEEAA